MRNLFFTMMFISTAALADEVYVVSTQPRYVTTYQQQCEQVQVYKDNGNVGTVIGGVAGGLVGSTIGKGSGNTAATIAGAVIGGSVGNSLGAEQGRMETKQVCRNIPITVQQGESVTFNYKGRTFTQIFQY